MPRVGALAGHRLVLTTASGGGQNLRCIESRVIALHRSAIQRADVDLYLRLDHRHLGVARYLSPVAYGRLKTSPSKVSRDEVHAADARRAR
jgi:hypothetical protein